MQHNHHISHDDATDETLNIFEQFVHDAKNDKRILPDFEPWEIAAYTVTIDILRTIVKHMSGETFAIKKGNNYFTVENRRALSDQDLINHARGNQINGCYFLESGSDLIRAAVFDLDNHGGLSSWSEMIEAAKKITAELRKDQIWPSLLVRSHGGQGIHIWLLFLKAHSAKEVRAYLTQILIACGFSPGNGGVINKQIEVFPKQDKADDLGSLIGLPFAGKGAALDPQTFEIVDRVTISICGKPFRPSSSEANTKRKPKPDDDKTRGFEAILAEIGDGIGLKGINEPLYRAAASYVAKFYELLDVEKLKNLMRKAIDEAPKGPTRTTKEIEDYKSDKYLDSIIKPAMRKFIELRGVRKEHFLAYMPTSKYIFIPIGELWPASSVDSRIEPIALVDDDGKPIMVGKGKNKKVKTLPASKWLSKKSAVEQMTWAPGKPQLIKDWLVDKGGWVEHPGSSIFNTYRPPPPIIINENALDASMWENHVHKVYPEKEAKHIIQYLAFKVQKPGEKINHALVLGGEQGIGKDTLLEPVKRAIGPWNVQEVSPKKLLDNFTGFLKSVILRVSEARDLGDVNRYALNEHMKSILAVPPDTIQVNEKHLPEYYIANVCGVVITTNNKIDGLYLTPDDRRHFVAWSHLTKEDFTTEYWNGIWSWYEQGGCQAIAVYLQNLDLSDFDPKAPPEQTDAFHAIVSASESSERREMLALFDAMENPKAVIIEELANAAMKANLGELADWLDDRKNRRSIPHRLLEAGYGLIPNPDTKDKKMWQVNKREVTIYGPMRAPPQERTRWARDFKKRKEAEAEEEPDLATKKSRYFSEVSKPPREAAKKSPK